MTLLECLTLSLTSSSRLELHHTIIRNRGAVLTYDVPEPKASVILYISVDNLIQFVLFDITQVHRIAVSGGAG